MPMGNELHYCVTGPDSIIKLLGELGLQMMDYDDNPIPLEKGLDADDLWGIANTPRLQEIDKALGEAHRAACEAQGWKYLGLGKELGDNIWTDTPFYDTEWGQRIVSPFGLSFVYDPHEAGDDLEMASLGVGLSSRYIPTFLDMKSAHGCLYNLDLRDAFKKSELAIAAITGQVPELDGLELVIREIFY